jgi:hypothetical protein
MQAVKLAVAFLFRRAGEGELTEEALARQASLDLHWFAPKDARRFIDAARALGYLKAGELEGRVAPAFDVRGVEVPLDFRIDARALDGAPSPPSSSVTEALVQAAARARGRPLDEVWAEVLAKQGAKLLDAPAAAALIAAQAGVDLKPFFARIREELNEGAGAPL